MWTGELTAKKACRSLAQTGCLLRAAAGGPAMERSCLTPETCTMAAWPHHAACLLVTSTCTWRLMTAHREVGTTLIPTPSTCSMCLFVQSQDFHRHTELLINTLHGAAQHAAGQLAGIDASLTEQHTQLQSMAATVEVVGTQQQQLADDVAQTAEGITTLQDNTAALADAMAESLRHEVSRDPARRVLVVVHWMPSAAHEPLAGSAVIVSMRCRRSSSWVSSASSWMALRESKA